MDFLSMSPGTGNRFPGSDMRKNRSLKQERDLKDRGTL